MARTRKSIQPLNLYKYDVLIEDQGPRSDYFKISQFDGYFYGGRNAFLVAGAGVLRPGSKILVEILNKNGTTVYSAPITKFVEGNSRMVQVEVYSDTPIGPGKIVLLGNADKYIDGTPIPEEWRDKYNVRWVTDVVISPLVYNKTPIRFETSPSVVVEEKFYNTPSSSLFTENINVPVNIELTPKYYNVFPNGYQIRLTGPGNTRYFSKYVGGTISGSIYINTNGSTETASISLPITRIYNSTLAESTGKLIYTDKQNLLLDGFISNSGAYTTTLSPFGSTTVTGSINLVYNNLETFSTGSETSFAKLRVVDAKTLSGEINKVRVSYKSSTQPGEYVTLSDVNVGVVELFAVDSGSNIAETGRFRDVNINDYWYAATMSVERGDSTPTLPAYYASASQIPDQTLISQCCVDLLDSISATPTVSASTYIDNVSSFIGNRLNNSLTLFPRSEYTLAFDAFVSKTSASIGLDQSDYGMEVFLVPQENSETKLLETNPRGQLLGKLTPQSNFQKQNFERVEFNFSPRIIQSGKFGLRFVFYGGFWNIANVSVKTAQEPFFSPDELDILIPIIDFGNDILEFRTEYLDINNNTAGISTFSVPLYVTGSQQYVKRSGDTMTGPLYVNGIVSASSFVGVFESASYALTSSYAPTFPYTGSAMITGSLGITGSLVVSGSGTLRNIGPAQFTGSVDVLGNQTITGSLRVSDTVTAREFYTQVVSSSIIYQSGSTKFGDTSDDVMSVTGSLRVQGSVSASSFTGSILATNGIVSSSTASSPSQGTVRVTINGVNTDVDTGLQTGDSPSFSNVTVTTASFSRGIINGNIDLQSFSTTYGVLSAISWHESVALSTNLRYTGSTDPTTTPGNWQYIREAGLYGTAGITTFMKGNGTETGTYFSILTAPTSLGAGATVTTLTERLRVSGDGVLTVNTPGIIRTGTGSLTTPSFAAHNDTNTGIYFPAADTIAFVEGGTETLRINSNSTVGINTTASVYPLQLRRVAGGGSIGITIDNVFGPTDRTVKYFAIGDSTSDFAGQVFYVRNGTVTDVAVLSLKYDGNVGIGTTSPATKLDVAGTTKTIALYVQGQSTDSGNIIVQSNGSTAYWISTKTDSTFHIGGNGGTEPTGAIVITSTGNVGIGLTNPGYSLSVSGSRIAVDGEGLFIGKVYNPDNNYIGLKTSYQSGTQDYMIISGKNTDGNTYISARSGASVVIRGGGNTTAHELNITSTAAYFVGNLGIGITSPGERLEVSGSIRLTTGANRYVQIGSVSNYYYRLQATGDDFQIIEGNNVAVRFHIDYPSGNVGLGTTSPGSKLHVSSSVGAIAQFEGGTGRYIYTGTDGVGHYIEQVGTTAGERVLRIQNSNGSGTYTQLILDGANQRIYTSTNVNVGIGTSSPSNKLDVIGNMLVQGTQGFNATNETATIYIGDSASYIQAVYDGGLDFYQNSTFRVRIQGVTGNVGIGTSSPNAKLHVSGGNAIFNAGTGGDSNSGLRIVAPIATTHYNWMLGAQQNVSATFEITPSTTVGGTTFSTPTAVFTAGGSVGIGTTAPGVPLQVHGNGTSNGYRGVIRIINTDGGQWGGLAFPDGVASDSSANNYYFIGRGSALSARTLSFHVPVSSDYGSGAQPRFLFASTGADELVTIQASTGNTYIKGTVGIGNTAAVTKLHIEGGSANWNETTPGTTVGTIHLDPGVATDNFGNAITFGASDTGNGENAQAGIYVRSDGSYGTKMYFATTDAYISGAKTAITIDNLGHVTINRGALGVGTTASTTAGEIRATNEITAYYSDARLKDFHGTIKNAISKVETLHGYYFTENEVAKSLGYTNDKMQVGVSAQEVQAVLPEAVVPAPIDDKYLTVKYEKLVPVLIEAIKEQQILIRQLQEKVDQLYKN